MNKESDTRSLELQHEEVVVVGMAGRFPGARNCEAFWRNLSAGVDSIRELPKERWDNERLKQLLPKTKIGSFCGIMNDIDLFDHRYFSISPREARQMDPQQRLLLEETVQCVRDAGIPFDELKERRTGAYVGFMALDQLTSSGGGAQQVDSFSGTGAYACLLANRLSYIFGMTGPSFSIDAACASSLVALHEAKEALLRGECDYALVAGVSLNLHPWKYMTWSKSHMLSPTGKCHTFDRDADGYVPGDGIGVIILQRARDARACGANVRGLIRGSAIGHGGATVSLTAPRVEAQQDVIQRAIDDARIDARTITYVEAHGTGTSLGDPIEVEALTRVHREHTDDCQYAAIGSLKSNVGHLEGASGIAGVIKVLLMMRHRSLVPTLNVRNPNPMIRFEQSPFRLALRTEPWKGTILRASVSSFGIGGVNSHVIIEEDPPPEQRVFSATPQLFTLSARSEDAFERLRQVWMDRFKVCQPAVFVDLCRSQVGATENEPVRVQFEVRDPAQGANALTRVRPAVAKGEQKVEPLVIPYWELTGFAPARKLYDTQPGFRSVLDMLAANAGDVLGDQLYRETWSSGARRACSDLVSMAFWLALVQLGIRPGRVAAEGRGLVLACALADMADPVVLLRFSWELVSELTGLGVPSCPIFDPALQSWVSAPTFDGAYLEQSCRELAVDEQTLDPVLVRARTLAKGQRTYQKFLAEWDDALLSTGHRAAQLLAQPELLLAHTDAPRVRALLYIISETALRKLDRKWSLHLRAKAAESLLETLIELTIDNLLPRSLVVALLLDKRDRESLAQLTDEALRGADAAKIGRAPLLKEGPFRTASWLRSALQTPAPELRSLDGWSRRLNALDLQRAFTQALGEAWLSGADVRWPALYAPGSYLRQPLPAYPFDGVRFPFRQAPFAMEDKGVQGSCEELPAVFRDHVIAGVPLVPAACALAALQRATDSEEGAGVRNVHLYARRETGRSEPALRIERDGTMLHVHCDEVRMAVAELSRAEPSPAPEVQALVGRASSTDLWSQTAVYGALHQAGYQYGPSLRIIRSLKRCGAGYAGELSVPEDVADTDLFPCLIDGALQVPLASWLLGGEAGHDSPRPLPARFGRFTCPGSVPRKVRAYVLPKTDRRRGDVLCADILCVDAIDRTVLTLEDVGYRGTIETAPASSSPAFDLGSPPLHYRMLTSRWTPVFFGEPQGERRYLVVESTDDHTLSALSIEARHRGWSFSRAGEREAGKPPKAQESPSRLHVFDATRDDTNALTADEAATAHARRLFAWLKLRQRSLSAKQDETTLLIITRKAQAVVADDRAEGYAGAVLAGLALSAQKEFRGLRICLVDVDRSLAGHARLLLSAACDGTLGPVLALRGGRIFARMWHAIGETRERRSLFSPGKHYLVVGGRGGIGRAILADTQQIDCRISVLGRSAPTDHGPYRIGRSERLDLRADVSSQASLEYALDRAVRTLGPLHGVLHLAGLTRDRLLVNKEWDDFEQTLAPKLRGTLLLHELTRGQPLECFVLFSSTVALDGNSGQTDYAAANSFQDAFAAFRARGGAPGRTLVINWPLWLGTGMGKTVRKNASYLHPITPAMGVEALRAAYGLRSENTQVCVQGKASEADATPKGERKDMHTDHTHSQVANVEALLRSTIAKQLQVNPDSIIPGESLFALGLDSLVIQDLTQALEPTFGELPPTLFFERPYLEQLIAYFEEKVAHKTPPDEHGERPAPISPSESGVISAVTSSSRLHDTQPSSGGYDLAIIGIDGTFARAPDVDAYWRNLVDGLDCVQEVPRSRWDVREGFGDRTQVGPYSYGRWGSFIEDVDCFDERFFSISPKEAEEMDPQQRLFLQCAWGAMEDAGYVSEARLSSHRVGVFVGTMWNEYSLLAGRHLQRGIYGGPGSLYWAIANRVSYFMNLTGPSLAIDTACSSSLAAFHLGGQAILNGDCEMAIVGGVNLSLFRDKYVYLSQARFLSSDGRCRSFGADGDGYVPGEGVAAAVVKPLAQALEDKDQVYAVIRGSAVNHGGKATGFTVPNPEQQANVICEALRRAAVLPSQLGYVECHGTGTSLGDPIEVRALSQAFERVEGRELPRQRIPIGSVKSNIGHLEAAAGIAAVIKVVQLMKHGVIPKSLHAEAANPKLRLEDTPFRVAGANEPLRATEPGTTYACVSSFGAGGSNAHLVLEGRTEVRAPQATMGPYVFPISAKTPSALSRMVHDLRHKVESDLYSLRLADAAFTLQVGRRAFGERWVSLSSTREDLLSQLAAFPDVTADLQSGTPAARAASAFMSGEAPDWEPLRADDEAMTSLPTYSFERTRHWLGDEAGAKVQHEVRGSDAIVKDHVVNGRQVLPGGYFLSLASKWAHDETGCPDLKNVTFIRALSIEDQATLELSAETSDSPQPGSARIVSLHAAGQNRSLAHASAAQVSSKTPERIAETQLTRLDVAGVYEGFARRGLSYGPTFRSFSQIAVGEGMARGRLDMGVASGLGDASDRDAVVFDALLQACLFVARGQDDGTDLFLPCLIGSVRIQQPLVRGVSVEAYLRRQTARGLTCEVALYDNAGYEVAVLHSVVLALADRDVTTPQTGVSANPSDPQLPASLFRVEWAEKLSTSPDAQPSGSDPVDLVVIDKASEHVSLLEKMVERTRPGSRVFSVVSREQDVREPNAVVLAPGSLASIERWLASLGPEGRPLWLMDLRGCIESEQTIGDAPEAAVEALLPWLQAILRSRLPAPRILVGYHGDAELNPSFSALHGVLRTAAKEDARLSCVCVGSQHERAEDRAAAFIRELSASVQGCRETVVTDTAAFEPVWRPVAREQTESPASSTWIAPGAYLITGGAGGLGRAFAERLLREEGVSVVLTGRRKISGDVIPNLDSASAEPRVFYLNGDVSRRSDVARWVRFARGLKGGLRGVLHAAGVRRDAFLVQKTVQQVREVVRPKVLGALHLDELTQDDPLKLFALFSSLTAVLGNAGQADYAYANAFMDAFAVRRNAAVNRSRRSGQTVSLNWPLWQGVSGMTVAPAELKLLERTMGIQPMSAAQGLEAFDLAARTNAARIVVFTGDLSKVRQRIDVNAPEGPAMVSAMNTSDINEEYTMNKTKPALIGPALIGEVSAIMARLLKLRLSEVDEQADLRDFGFDSVSFASFAAELSEAYGFEISPAIFFQYSNLIHLTEYLIELGATPQAADTQIAPEPVASPAPQVSPECGGLASDSVVDSERPRARTASAGEEPLRRANHASGPDGSTEPVAVVGLRCTLPGATDSRALLQLLSEQRELPAPVPAERRALWEVYAERQPELVRAVQDVHGAFLDDVAGFDAAFFNISPREADLMDPQQRLFLQTVWHTVEDAGYRMRDLWGRQVGVFVGVSTADYAELLRVNGVAVDGVTATGLFHSVLANRISYLFNFTGPCEPIDTACSSSLVAIDRAVRALRSGQCEMAIAGGVNLLLSPTLFAAFSEAGMLSPRGRCRTFDAAADGYVRGEGVGAVLLKPLSKAEADGDHIYGLVRASAIRHAGRANSLTAPNAKSQTELLVQVYTEAGVDSRCVGYIETHGTATNLGDPIEIEALKSAFAELEGADACVATICRIGSIKTNIGHLEAAAGISGFAKALLSVQHGKIFGNANFEQLNKHIHLTDGRFAVATCGTDWQGPDPRIAGVSSFGFGGVNAHVVLEQYIPGDEVHATAGASTLFVLSAESETQLRAYAGQMAEHVKTEGQAQALSDLAYTSRVGRTAMEHRLALVVDDHAKLAEGLRAYTEGRAEECAWLYVQTGVPTDPKLMALLVEGPEGIAYCKSLLQGNNMDKLARLWTAGLDIDWSAVDPGGRLFRVSMPGYPFKALAHWYSRHPGEEALREPAPVTPAPLEPPPVDRGADTRPPITPLKLSLIEPNADSLPPVAPHAPAAAHSAGNAQSLAARCLADTLKISVADLERTCSFKEMGMDSIMTLKFAKALGAKFGATIEPKLVFEAETLGRLESQLSDLLETKEVSVSEPRDSEPQAQKAVALSERRLSGPQAKGADVESIARETLSDVLFLDPSEVDYHRPFAELGLDSVLGLEFVKKLGMRLSLSLNASALYEHADLARLVTHLRTLGSGGKCALTPRKSRASKRLLFAVDDLKKEAV